MKQAIWFGMLVAGALMLGCNGGDDDGTPSATATPEVTATVEGTATGEPTATAEPTSIAEPTATAEATGTASATGTATAEPVDPNDLDDPQEALDAARALWESNSISDYGMEFNWLCFCPEERTQIVQIEVRDRAILGGSGPDGEPLSENRLEDYRTIEGLFDFIQEAIDAEAYEIGVTYDRGFGFPSRARIDYQELAVDEEQAFEIHTLTPVK
jgi:hypothetical protein